MTHYRSERVPDEVGLGCSTSLQGHDWRTLLRVPSLMESDGWARNSQAKKNINDMAICRTG